jgi:hypothetical protein
LVGDGQVLGVAVHEIQPGQIVPFLAKLYAGRVQVQPGEQAGLGGEPLGDERGE